jgi:hypothetical protein
MSNHANKIITLEPNPTGPMKDFVMVKLKVWKSTVEEDQKRLLTQGQSINRLQIHWPKTTKSGKVAMQAAPTKGWMHLETL